MKIGNGFGFRIVQAVLYTLAALVFVILGAVFAVRATDYAGTLFYDYGNDSKSVDGYYKGGQYYDAINEWSAGQENYCYVRRDAGGRITLEISRYNQTTDKNVKTVYAFEKNDNSAKRMVFSNGTETVEVDYSDVRNYGWEEYYIMSIVFLSLGAALAVVDVLHLIATFKGRKSIGANVLGIVVNLPFALGTFGLCGLVGCIKGRMYLQFTGAGYAAGAPVQPQNTDSQNTVTEQPSDGAVQMGIDTEPQTEESVQPEAAADKKYVKKSEFKLDLYDASIDEKTWKEFKNTATQDELAVIAIGAKYRVAHSRIKNILFAIGIILSIALFWPTGGYSLIAYPVFAFLSTKSIRYEDTLSQAYRKLNKENKAFVDSYFNCGIGWTILDILIKIGVFWLTIPYQAILLFIGLFAPNFVISKNGILVSIPNGYDVGDLGAVGAYYSGFGFIDEALANKGATAQPAQSGSPADEYYKKDEYTYTDSHGYEQTVYSGDGKDFYDAGGHYVGSSDKEGGNFKKKE